MIKKVAVLGCAGFIGSNLTDELLKKGYQVIGIDNLSRGTLENLEQAIKNPSFKFFNIDIRDKGIVDFLYDVDTIFLLAALARIQPSIENPIEYHDNNLNGTLNVLESAKEAGVKRIVFSSSSSAYGIQEKMPESEDMTPNPLNPYAAQKLMAEYYMKVYANCYGIETVSLRYFNVYGFRQALSGSYATVIGIFLDKFKKNERLPIIGTGMQKRDFTWVGDVVNANILASTSRKVGNGEVINIGTNKNYSVLEVAELVGGKTEFLPKRPFEVMETLADNSKAKELLNWQPKFDLKEGIRILKNGRQYK